MDTIIVNIEVAVVRYEGIPYRRLKVQDDFKGEEMGLTFKAQEKEYKRILGGSHFAVCDMVVDVGLQDTFFGVKPQVYVRFEVPAERWEYEKDGKKMEGPGVIGNFYTGSMSTKANLRKFLEGWRGKKFTEAEAQAFDIGSVLGKACLLNIQESQKGDKTYSNIVSAAPIMKGMEPPKAELPLLIYYPGKEEMFSALPEWIRKKIETQIPAPEVEDPVYQRDETEIDDDDIPF